jgi:hypothetical protein
LEAQSISHQGYRYSSEKKGDYAINLLSLPYKQDAIAAWALFLKNVLVSKPEKKAWQKLLETLLDAPQSYSSSILRAAMERYTELVGVAGPEIEDERALDLPILAPSKRGRARR